MQRGGVLTALTTGEYLRDKERWSVTVAGKDYHLRSENLECRFTTNLGTVEELHIPISLVFFPPGHEHWTREKECDGPVAGCPPGALIR